MLNLYATSTLTAIAFDAAREVAGSGGGPAAEAAAEARARSLLGGIGRPGSLRFDWRYPSTDGDTEPDEVELRVRARAPTRLVRGVDLPFSTVERTVRVRLERFR